MIAFVSRATPMARGKTSSYVYCRLDGRIFKPETPEKAEELYSLLGEQLFVGDAAGRIDTVTAYLYFHAPSKTFRLVRAEVFDGYNREEVQGFLKYPIESIESVLTWLTL